MTSPIARDAAEQLVDIIATVMKKHGATNWDDNREMTLLFAAIIQSHLAQAIKESGAIEALERAIQYVPYNAINAKRALTEPIYKCRTLNFCETALLRLRALSGEAK